MPSFSKNNVVLVQYPFTDLSAAKVRPAIVVSTPHPSLDLFVVPLTSRLANLQPGEFILKDWATAGLNLESAVKRGIIAIHPRLVVKSLAALSPLDATQLELALRLWLGL